ncbi:hypothetical protein GH714_031174 [Hevea brasiliensis]|uniref:Small ribosomal subunit protein uS7 domain-containing protein n=1 Tax=Hevea brasiliensis TaxID=3981 RepID=A0A6A6M4G8_HEVBR|nr:hypothetical protein GH714_031174 [Hevea brasiliensis]
MVHDRNNGKKLIAIRIVKHAMEIIHLLADQNPIQVIMDAVINSGPREDATRIGSAGVIRRQAVDISPLRHVNHAIYLHTTSALEAAFKNIKTIHSLIFRTINIFYAYFCHDPVYSVMPSTKRMRLKELPKLTVKGSL